MAASALTIAEAYRACRKIARRHYENFPVASRLVPRDKRNALAAIYAFARAADDYADEPKAADSTPESRLDALAAWRKGLVHCYEGEASDPVFVALADAAQKYRLTRKHFEDLLSAFEMDVRVSRYADFASLLKYCSFSANPVGRLVLELFGHRDADLFALGDHMTTALQLTNFWQDVGQDLDRDRIYLPLEDLRRFNLSIERLRTFNAAPAGEPEGWNQWQQLMAFEIARTRNLLESSLPLTEKVVPPLPRQLRLTWLGGAAVLSRIEAAGYDVFRHRPKLGPFDFVRLYFQSGFKMKALESRDATVKTSPK
ncbi:MAG: squalene synthase HpnC [Acidobacteria bacterium]|nr:squalene synthase HpnC [Acidobacteriota bacterium]